jgi:ribonuclease BN (tRNA processing enzyme)
LIVEIGEGPVLDEPGLRVEAMRNVHPPIADSFALAFHGNGRKVVFSGDTAPMPQMVKFAAGADLLVHEAMLEEAVDALVARVGNTDGRLKRHLLRSHSLAPEVGRIAKAAGVRALAINHLIPADDPAFTRT